MTEKWGEIQAKWELVRAPGVCVFEVLLYYLWYPTSREYFQSRISLRFCFKIPNPEPQIKKIPHPEKLTGDPIGQY